MLALREEYSDFRRKMRELEMERAAATTLNDRLKAVRHIEQLCTEVARPFEHRSEMRLETVFRYIPDAMELAANPTKPAGWAHLLLGKPMDALVSWYRRRPVRKLVRTAKTLGSLQHYERLLSKHFGEETSNAALERQHARRGPGYVTCLSPPTPRSASLPIVGMHRTDADVACLKNKLEH